MQRLTRFVIPVLAVVSIACGREPIASRWVDTPFVIDGDGVDWPIAFTTYVEETRGVLGVANDDSTLYLLFRFRDERTARRAMVGGVTIWWSQEGSKGRQVGIRCAPVVSLADLMPTPQGGRGPLGEEPREGGQRPSAERGRAPRPRDAAEGDRSWPPPDRGSLRLRIPTPEEGVLHRDVRLVTAKDPVGSAEWLDPRLSVQTGFRKGTYTYELALPLGAPGPSGVGIRASGGDVVRLTVSLGGIPEEDRDLVERRAPPAGAGPREPGVGMGERRDQGPRGSHRVTSLFADLQGTVQVSFSVRLASRGSEA